MIGVLCRLDKTPGLGLEILSMSLHMLDLHENVVVASGILFDKISYVEGFRQTG